MTKTELNSMTPRGLVPWRKDRVVGEEVLLAAVGLAPLGPAGDLGKKSSLAPSCCFAYSTGLQ
jgi:hypothetical protein